MQVLPQSVIIVITVGGSSVLVLAIIITMVVLCCVLCCVLCSRSRKRKNAADQQNGRGDQQSAIQEPLLNNPAYNVGNDFNDELVANPAYNIKQFTNNPAYNYNSDTDPYYSVIQT